MSKTKVIINTLKAEVDLDKFIIGEKYITTTGWHAKILNRTYNNYRDSLEVLIGGEKIEYGYHDFGVDKVIWDRNGYGDLTLIQLAMPLKLKWMN